MQSTAQPQSHENGEAGPGITFVRSILTRTKERGTTFKMNFIGLFNFLSLSDFISKSQVIHEPVSGDVVFKETASGERIEVITLPQAQEKLRKAIFDSILVTTAYRSSGALETMQMECSQVHSRDKTNERTMSDHLDWFPHWDYGHQRKGRAVQDSRNGFVHLHGPRRLRRRCCLQAMFLDSQGRPTGRLRQLVAAPCATFDAGDQTTRPPPTF